MNPRDIFGIILRTAGLLLLSYWALMLFGAIVVGNWGLVLVSLVVFLVGRYLLKGAPLILNFAYPQPAGGAAESARDGVPSIG